MFIMVQSPFFIEYKTVKIRRSDDVVVGVGPGVAPHGLPVPPPVLQVRSSVHRIPDGSDH